MAGDGRADAGVRQREGLYVTSIEAARQVQDPAFGFDL